MCTTRVRSIKWYNFFNTLTFLCLQQLCSLHNTIVIIQNFIILFLNCQLSFKIVKKKLKYFYDEVFSTFETKKTYQIDLLAQHTCKVGKYIYINKSIRCQEPVLVFRCLGSQVLRCDAGLCRAGRVGGREFCPGPSSSSSVSSPRPISVVSSQPSHVSPWHCLIIKTCVTSVSIKCCNNKSNNMGNNCWWISLTNTTQSLVVIQTASWVLNPQWQLTK